MLHKSSSRTDSKPTTELLFIATIIAHIFATAKIQKKYETRKKSNNIYVEIIKFFIKSLTRAYLLIKIRTTEIILFFKKKAKYLVISKKSSTFAADLDGFGF
jgi:hypothetical protein